MPLYEYECDSCGTRFERIQKFSDPPVAICPNCGGPVRKLMSSPAIQFKGSGFYITDYARSGQPETKSGKPSEGGKSEGKGADSTAKSDSSSESGKSGSAAETKTETKTETKSDAPTKPAGPKSTS